MKPVQSYRPHGPSRCDRSGSDQSTVEGRRRMDELQHECGIAAIYHLPGPASSLAPLAGADHSSRLMPRLLLDLQNRGQLAAGMASFDPGREKILDTYKQIGTVIEAFRLSHHAK